MLRTALPLASRIGLATVFFFAANAWLAAGPVSYWTFDGTAADSVSQNHGALNNGATYSPNHPAVLSGQSLSLDGTDDFFSVSPVGTVAGSYTVSLWTNILRTTPPSNVFDTRRPSDTSFDMKLSNGNLIHGDIGNGAAWINTGADASFTHTTNQWYHLAYVVQPGSYTIYANGVQQATGALGAGTPLLWNGAHQINMGRHSGGSEYTQGFIDDVAVWNSALSAAQISQLAGGTSPLTVGTTTFPPVGHAGALKYIRITNDADSQISSAKTYTHKLDFGVGTLPTANVNGVQFDAGGVGAFPGGNGSTTLPNAHAGNVLNTGTTGSVTALFEDMLFNDPNGKVTLTGLTPGQAYDTRLYIRNWDGAGANFNRAQLIQFDTNGNGGPERSVRINPDNSAQAAPGFSVLNGAYALSYNFVAQSTSEVITLNEIGGGTYHLYGLTNELTNRRPINSLFSSGLAASGARLAAGAPDPHYTLIAGPQGTPGSQALSITAHPGWAQNDDGSGFISVAEPGETAIAAGTYQYRTTFDLTGFNPATADLTLTMFADNTLQEVRLNGVAVPGITFSGFTLDSGKTFSINSGFLSGINTLDFFAVNDGPAAGPGGFRVDLSGSAVPIPEPAALVLLALGSVTMAGAAARRRAKR